MGEQYRYKKMSAHARLANKGIFTYDPNEGHLVTAFRVANTVVPHVLKRCEFWFFLLLHITICVLFYYNILPGRTTKMPYTKMDWNDVKVITAITTFFEVFYTNQCFSRYMHLYTVTRKLLVDVLHICLELRLQLRPNECQQHARLVARYLFASILIFFEDEVGKSRSEEGSKKRKLTRERLLRPEELAFLDKYPEQQKALIVLHWSAEVFMHAWKKAGLAANFQKSIIDKMSKVFAQTRDLADTVNLPIPFQYFHLLNLMVCVNLFCWAYIMGASDSAGGTMVFFFAALIFLGMMELASMLADPFGDDEVDFPSLQWLLEFFRRGELLLEYDHADQLMTTWKGELAHEGKLNLGLEPLVAPEDQASQSAWMWPRAYFSQWKYTDAGHDQHRHHHRHRRAHGARAGQAGYNAMADQNDSGSEEDEHEGDDCDDDADE